jgi:predicted ribosomally synthesized peptide with nif11-like leader
MSVENAHAFLSVFRDKPTMRTQLYVMSPRTIEDFLRFAHSKSGYSFSKEDLQTALKSFNNSSLNELKLRYSL